MSPDAIAEFQKYLAETPPDQIQRLFYAGHHVVYTIGKQDAKWRCRGCAHEWVGKDGETCPSCGAISK